MQQELSPLLGKASLSDFTGDTEPSSLGHSEPGVLMPTVVPLIPSQSQRHTRRNHNNVKMKDSDKLNCLNFAKLHKHMILKRISYKIVCLVFI